jgi:general secretion pathway protein A
MAISESPVPNPRSPGRDLQGIYGSFFGLKERPFDLTPNSRFLYLSSRQREAQSNLLYGLTTPRGFTLLIGEAGCGKTTILRATLSQLNDARSRCLLIDNPTLGRMEFYECLTRGFGLSEAAVGSKTRFLEEMHRNVQERFDAGGLTGLVVDEAQSLPYELLEEIRLLGNMEVASQMAFNIVLSGQPELADRLSESSLRQLKQRIGLRCELKPFDLAETSAYVAGRLRIAGGLPEEIFTREAVMAIYRASAGLPRTINVLCDNALIGGFAAQIKPVTARVIMEVARDFDVQHAQIGMSRDVSEGPPRLRTGDQLPAVAREHAQLPEAAGEDEPNEISPSRLKRLFSLRTR